MKTGRMKVIVVESLAPPMEGDVLDRAVWVAARLRVPFVEGELQTALTQHRPRLVLCTSPIETVDETFLAVCDAHRAEVCVLARPDYGALMPLRLRRLAGLPWVRLERPLRARRPRGRLASDRVKRCLDLTLTLLTAPITVPLMLLIMVAASRNGPPLYFQNRVGIGGRTFRMVKYRTMVVDAERDVGPTLADVDDARVTRLGRVLRRFRLDELPQLWNVLRGEMSLVGPRPERPEFVAELRRLPHYELRELMRPGLTGIAQLTCGYRATAAAKLRCDLLYLHSRSLGADLRLLALTVVELFRGFPHG